MMKNRQMRINLETRNKKSDLSQAENEDDRRVDHAQQHFGQHIPDDAEPYSPLDSVHSRFDEEECLDHPPRLIVYADYSARSEFSLDFQYEEESEAEVRINHLLKAMDYQLESTDWGDLSSKQTYFEDEEADGDFFNRSFLLDRSNKKKKSQEEELRNYCKIWGTRFCHIGVRGTSIVGEQSYDGFTSLEDISKNDMTVRDIALFGGVEEEITEEEGDYSELIALDVTLPVDESEKDVCAQRSKRYSAKGFPPIEPEECMKDNVLHLLFENIWNRMCEVMKPLCMTYIISTRTPRHLQLKTATKKNPAMHVEPFRTHMKPSKSSMDQNIQFGLGDAVSIRPYRTSTPQRMTTKKKGRRRRKQNDSTKPNVSRRQKQKTGVGSERDYNHTHYEKEAPSNSPALTKDSMFPPLYQKPIMQRTNTYDNSSSNPSFKFPSISGVQRAPKYLLARAQTAIPPDYFVPPLNHRPTSTRSKQHHVVFRNAPKRDTLFQNYSASEQKVIKFDSSLSVHSAPLHLLNEEHSNQKPHK